ncbi:MAG: phosphoribosylanthranilate isomerase [Spartobacteria bacterium]|nr:phosphoribosylanthranilate isomerase [Spartobacteria bacterium]
MNVPGPFVKICGLTSAEDVRAVVALKPDAVGFVFWAPSKRYVTPRQVAEWAALIPSDILKVGVFVDAGRDVILETVRQAGLEVVQLHGGEAPEACDGFPVQVWKALHLDRVDERSLSAYQVDAFLIDSYSTDAPGGTGRCCDWRAVRTFVEKVSTPVLLAGGLESANVREALEQTRPWGVDVSSGVEKAPGVKDRLLVKEFIEQCRQK